MTRRPTSVRRRTRPAAAPTAAASQPAVAAGESITKAELVKRFAESPKQVERFVLEGIPCVGQGRTRRFPWPAARHWRDERIRRQERERLAPKPEPMEGLRDAERRTAIADAELKELKLAQLRGELVAITEFRQELADALTRVRMLLLRRSDLPPAVADALLRELQAEPPPVEDPPLEPATAA